MKRLIPIAIVLSFLVLALVSAQENVTDPEIDELEGDLVCTPEWFWNPIGGCLDKNACPDPGPKPDTCPGEGEVFGDRPEIPEAEEPEPENVTEVTNETIEETNVTEEPAVTETEVPEVITDPEPIVEPEPVVQPEPVSFPEYEPPEPPKSNLTLILIIIGVLVVISLGGAAYILTQKKVTVKQPPQPENPLRKYIDNMKAKGYQDAQIKQNLLSTGYKEQQIAPYFQKPDINQAVNKLKQQGLTKDQIKDELLKQGHSILDVYNALKNI